jgi:hypothetical protein
MNSDLFPPVRSHPDILGGSAPDAQAQAVSLTGCQGASGAPSAYHKQETGFTPMAKARGTRRDIRGYTICQVVRHQRLVLDRQRRLDSEESAHVRRLRFQVRHQRGVKPFERLHSYR